MDCESRDHNSRHYLMLRTFIAEGKIESVKDCIESGFEIRFPQRNKRTERNALCLSVETGFFSLIEMLLKKVKWTMCELEYALCMAISERRLKHIVELLLDHGAPISGIRMYEVIKYMDFDLLERFIKLGLDPERDETFADCLDLYRARPLLRYYRDNRERFPSFDRQINKALLMAVSDNALQWSILLIWAGADPNLVCDDPTDEKNYEYSAWELASIYFSFESLAKLNGKPNLRNKLRIACHAAWYLDCRKLKWVTDQMGKRELSEFQSGATELYDQIIGHEEVSIIPRLGPDKTSETIECLKLLNGLGLKWSPEIENVRNTRRAIAKKSDYHVRQVVKFIVDHEIAKPAVIWELVRTPTIRKKLENRNRDCWKQLKRDFGT